MIAPIHTNSLLLSVGGKRTRCLIDTGATVSCASLAYLRKTKIDVSSIEPANISQIVGVGNEKHDILGTLNIPLIISGATIDFSFYILAELRHPLILGMDFLTSHNVVIDLSTSTISIHDQLITACLIQSPNGLVRTTTAITVPAESEINVEAKVSNRRTGEVVLLEPVTSLCNRSLAGARCLVQVRKGKAPIRLLNPTSNDIHISRQKVIATVADIDQHILVPLADETVDTHNIDISATTSATSHVNSPNNSNPSTSRDNKLPSNIFPSISTVLF
ncbi:MAG: retropepsin-like aspartic protease [Sedimenticola sp.]